MKIVKVGSTKLIGKATNPKTSKTEQRRKRAVARKIADRSSFNPAKFEKPTNARLKKRAKQMRRTPTLAERRMSERLTEAGIAHRTQVVVGWYIADILITTRRLIIELDGAHHYTDAGALSDFRRTKWLQQFGFTVLRCENQHVEEWDIEQIEHHPIHIKRDDSQGVKAANKERNRALYHLPVQQDRYKSKRKRQYSTEKWQDVPRIDARGRIIKR